MRIELEIPGLPPMNTSDKVGRWAWRKQKSDWERHVCAAVLVTLGKWLPEPWPVARVKIVRNSTARPDYDNLVQGGKFILDGLKKAGVIVDDGAEFLVGGRAEYDWEYARPGKGFVSVVVERAEGES